ncbi:MAG: glycerate kinase [Bacillus subtilis]|nr:glycerate kinase [Bacillus subtilis]
MIRDVEFTTLCDVDNPLFGSLGAAYVYAPQKARRRKTSNSLIWSFAHSRRYSKLKYFMKPNFPERRRGRRHERRGETLLEFQSRQRHRRHSRSRTNSIVVSSTPDAVISGEGKLDRQSFYGKVIGGLHQRMAIVQSPAASCLRRQRT